VLFYLKGANKFYFYISLLNFPSKFSYNPLMKKSLLSLIPILLFTACQDIDDNKPLLSNSKKKQPIIIVNRNRHLNMAEFWIDKVEKPYEEIMSPKEIEAFNKEIAHKNHTLNYFSELNSAYGASWVKGSILKAYEEIKGIATYFEDGNRIDSKFYKGLKKDLNLESIGEGSIKTRFAITTNYCDQKIVPTDLELLKKKNQIHFDRNQNSALDIGTPIAILHSTKDGLWHYGIGPTSSGWVHSKDIAFGTKEEIANYLSSKNFVVTIAPKTALKIAGNYHDYFRMGVRLPALMNIDDETMVMVPTADSEGNLVLTNATVRTANVHKGYLKYTPENILLQAFKFLHEPYGWGGMYGEQDCSKFIQEVYATVGLKLPRNSTSQSNVGESKIELAGLSKESKHTFLKTSGIVGGTILHLKGHITMYIGEYKGEPYIIHTVWGESSKHFALGRTAVTSLNFNNYLGKIDRLTNLTAP